MSSENFYTQLRPLENFIDITDSQNFVSVPNDWYIIISDITGSTEAIEQGRYKDVNLLGACSIIAVLNAASKVDIPFVFGGDGASILIPPSLFAGARQALLSTQQLAKDEFGIDLRVGIVPVAVVIAADYAVKIAKVKVSDNYSQAMFTGGGLAYATDLIKDPSVKNIYKLTSTTTLPRADLSGLECRWQDIPSRHGEILSLIVLATGRNTQHSNDVYQGVVEEIQRVYGDDENYHPIVGKNLDLTFSTQKLLKETRLRAKSGSWLDKQLYLGKIKLENLLGTVLMNFKVKAETMDWGLYKSIVADATDYKKFDDMLRMVISGSSAQREQITNYLEGRYKAGELVYGTHVSDRALMTCLVIERDGPQVHFIDGADGGYALAAKGMKEQLKRKALNWTTYANLNRRRKPLSQSKSLVR